MIGLRKVSGNMPVPGLIPFYKDVCNLGSDKAAYLNLGHIPLGSAGSQWAAQADYQYMTSCMGNCFDPVTMITFLNQDNKFPIFPVLAAEWDWLVSQLPEPPPVYYEIDQMKNPCSTETVPIYPEEYGCMKVDRLCLWFPELHGNNKCERPCNSVTPITTTPKVPIGECFDCYWEEVWYTIVAAYLVYQFSRCFSQIIVVRYNQIICWVIGGDAMNQYSPMSTGRGRNMQSLSMQLDSSSYWRAVPLYFFGTLFLTVFVYGLLHLLDIMVSVWWLNRELCLRIFGWTTCNKADGYWTWGDNGYQVYIYDVACFWRLVGEVFACWFCFFFLIQYWHYSLNIAVKEVSIIEEETIEGEYAEGGAAAGGAAGGFAAGAVCNMM